MITFEGRTTGTGKGWQTSTSETLALYPCWWAGSQQFLRNPICFSNSSSQSTTARDGGKKMQSTYRALPVWDLHSSLQAPAHLRVPESSNFKCKETLSLLQYINGNLHSAGPSSCRDTLVRTASLECFASFSSWRESFVTGSWTLMFKEVLGFYGLMMEVGKAAVTQLETVY